MLLRFSLTVCFFAFSLHHSVQCLSVGAFVNGTDDKTVNIITPQQKYLANQARLYPAFDLGGYQDRNFKNQNSDLLKDDYMKSDDHVIGWLRANKWNFANTARMLRRSQSWRAVNKIEELGKMDLSGDMEILFPFRIEAKDEQGCPVLEVELGQWDVTDHMNSAIFTRDAVESFAKHAVQMWEKARMALQESVPQCAQIVLLQDMQGYSANHVSDSNSVAAIIKMVTNLETYYPNLIKEAHLINANDDVKSYLDRLKPYYMQSTLNVMNVYSEQDQEWQDHVLINIDPEQLPPRYGGVKGLF